MLPGFARLIAVATGMLSLWLMFRVGSRQQNIMLIVMFTVWVALPYGLMLLMGRRSRQWQWTDHIRNRLGLLSIILSLISVAIYAYIAFGPSRPQPAFWLMVTPTVSLAALGAFWFWQSMKHK